MRKINSQLLSGLYFEQPRIHRINAREIGDVKSVTEEEVKTFDFSHCPNCRASIKHPSWIEKEYQGGGSFDYRIHNCEWCGWWNIFKIRVSPKEPEKIISIRQVLPESKQYQSLNDFNHYEEHPEIQFLIRLLESENERLKEVSWAAFQSIAKAYLLDQGMYVADISRVRSSGGDLLCLDANGKVIIVEVKHLNKRPVDIGTVWKVLGVMTSEGLDGGMLITSHRFSPDATTLMERGSIGRITKRAERRGMKYVDRETMIRWLHDVQTREHQAMLTLIDDFLLQEVYDEGGA